MNDAEARSTDKPATSADEASSGRSDDAAEQRWSLFAWGAEFLKRLAALRRAGAVSLRQNLQDELAREADSGTNFTPEERVLLSNILRLREVRVDDVMIPRADIDSVEDSVPLARLMEIFRESGHSRMPVYHDGLDDPRGMVHIKDLMAYFAARATEAADNRACDAAEAAEAADGESGPKRKTPKSDAEAAVPAKADGADDRAQHFEETGAEKKPSGESDATDARSNRSVGFDLSSVDLSLPLNDTGLIRPVLFVPPSMPATDLMAKMQADRVQMALVIDEYGGTDGLVSLEDVVETVVGDIEDEHDEDEDAMIEKVAEGVWVADPRVPVEEMEEAIGADFELGDLGEEIDTLGGLVFTLVGRVPVRGELITSRELPRLEFEVLDADPRRIKRLRIRTKRPDARLVEARRRMRRPDTAA
ncbi:transporter associated domain-containing protein [Stappia sp. ES.058]|uniref:transporter associated domain-containing protein n=1 Tax=Stappia sp. ES.058 TaxID=1881061 RepID=UPI00087A8CA1|nr:hemolysin family protein [Stappia sp. ES.058]SDU46490.1 CBS domain-containing protein [Stappia sp. ES.058]